MFVSIRPDFDRPDRYLTRKVLAFMPCKIKMLHSIITIWSDHGRPSTGDETGTCLPFRDVRLLYLSHNNSGYVYFHPPIPLSAVKVLRS